MRHDAIEFFESLFRSAAVIVSAEYPISAKPEPKPPSPTMAPDDLSAEWREEYEERVAIREYDGGSPREVAEHFALLDVLEMMKSETRRS